MPELDEEMVKSFGIEDGTVESLRTDIRRNMERELGQRVDSQIKSQVMDGLVDCNEIEVAQIEKLASSYQDPQEVIDHYYGDQEMLRNIEGLVLEEAVTERVLAVSSVTDEQKSFKEIMNPPTPEAPQGASSEPSEGESASDNVSSDAASQEKTEQGA